MVSTPCTVTNCIFLNKWESAICDRGIILSAAGLALTWDLECKEQMFGYNQGYDTDFSLAG